MKKKWRKLGHLYTPNGVDRHSKIKTHAANPMPVLLDGDIYRIFFSGRDAKNRSSVGAVDIDIVKRKIIYSHGEPFFEHGPADSFYSAGVSIGNCYKVQEVQYMLFMGWQNPKGCHWRGDIGRLIVRPDYTLELDSTIPLLGADSTDPISLSYPWVIQNKAGGYHMWYGSTKTWNTENGEMLHVINHAISTDGHIWKRLGLAIPYEIGIAQAFSRPTVIGDDDQGYDMWFSFRSGKGKMYRIGYAYSKDGVEWKISLENAGIEVSSTGWDSEMIEYPFVFDHMGERYMLYNGNGYGQTGFGLAVLESL